MDALTQNGVPQSAIIPEDKSGYTRENAMRSRQVINERGLLIHKAIICCKSFHARRCLMFYQLAFPETELFIVPVECYSINKNNWHEQEYGVERVMGELSRCGNQFVDHYKDLI